MKSRGGNVFPDPAVDPTGMEYNAMKLLKDALEPLCEEVVILNDFTKADMLLRLTDGDEWYQIQVKTTSRFKANGWGFANTKSYNGMIMVFIAVLEDRGWLMTSSYASKQKSAIRISRGGHCKHHGNFLSARNYGEMAANVLKMISRHSLRMVSQEDARFDLSNPLHRIEMEGIMQWKHHIADHQNFDFRWPQGQALPYDAEIRDCTGNHWQRIQFKTPTASEYSGFNVTLIKQAGRKEGKPTHKPCQVGDADWYVFVLVSDQWVDVWTFHESTLAGNNPNATPYITTATSTGKKSMGVHLQDPPVDRKPVARNGMLWTRDAHWRFERTLKFLR
tara:strand:+ start:681 stop:1682 length:1002 start_codon:yes stop_codon:yes gene_type:complete